MQYHEMILINVEWCSNDLSQPLLFPLCKVVFLLFHRSSWLLKAINHIKWLESLLCLLRRQYFKSIWCSPAIGNLPVIFVQFHSLKHRSLEQVISCVFIVISECLKTTVCVAWSRGLLSVTSQFSVKMYHWDGKKNKFHNHLQKHHYPQQCHFQLLSFILPFYRV